MAARVDVFMSHRVSGHIAKNSKIHVCRILHVSHPNVSGRIYSDNMVPLLKINAGRGVVTGNEYLPRWMTQDMYLYLR